MAISTFTDFEDKVRNATASIVLYKNGMGHLYFGSSWTQVNTAGAVPTTSAACYNTTLGALNTETSVGISGTDYRLVRTNIERQQTAISPGIPVVVDRLVHSGGLSGTVTTAQTTNLPTTALPRYTDGIGVFIGLEIYSTIGTTATTVTASYTNQAGTPGRTTLASVFGGSSFNAVRTLKILPLQDGDTGVLSVESVTLAASTVSAPGNFGVTLFKPLHFGHLVNGDMAVYGSTHYNALIGGAGALAQIETGACLMLCGMGTTSGVYAGILDFVDVT